MLSQKLHSFTSKTVLAPAVWLHWMNSIVPAFSRKKPPGLRSKSVQHAPEFLYLCGGWKRCYELTGSGYRSHFTCISFRSEWKEHSLFRATADPSVRARSTGRGGERHKRQSTFLTLDMDSKMTSTWHCKTIHVHYFPSNLWIVLYLHFVFSEKHLFLLF